MSQISQPNFRPWVSIAPEENLLPELVTLPDLPLLNIIKNIISLKSLILDIPLVHPRFDPICKIALKENPRLILYIGHLESIQEFKCSFRIGIPFENHLVDATRKHRFCEPEFYRLHYVTLNSETVAKLFNLMPAISHLEIVISKVNNRLISQINCLLTHWASTLKWLKFCSRDFQPDCSPLFFTLFLEMNSKLSALEHLTLDLDGELFVDRNFLPHQRLFDGNFPPGLMPQRRVSQRKLDLPILGQLKEFFFQTRDKSNLGLLLDTLKPQAGEQLTEIGLGLPFERNQYYNSNLVNHPLAARFTLLSTRYEPPYELTSFPNLKGFTAHWHLIQSLNSVTSRLSILEHLQYLELRRFPANENESSDPFQHSLPSVEILRINFNNSFEFANQDHTVLEDDLWESLFPSVQIVNLIHMGDFCAKCYPNEDNCSDNPPGFSQTRERLSCLSQLLAPLTVLPSLRKIFYQRNNDLKNIAEFTGKGDFVKTHAYIY